MIRAEPAGLVPGGLFGSPSSIKRRLAAVVFADVAGFSRLIALNDVETMARWKALRQDIMEPHMARLGGRIAQVPGDAVLAEFRSVVNAVRWAGDVQRTMKGQRRSGDAFALQLRISVNVEDIIDDDGILQGDGVNIAARIHQAAEPGQIVATATVRDFVGTRLPVEFHDLGTPKMKNIERVVHIYEVRWIESAKADVVAQPYLQWSSRPTVAVLPFQYKGAGEDSSYLGEGIADKIISGLSRSRSLFVIARNSSQRYHDRSIEVAQIARELGVRFIVDGSVQQNGDRLRIATELTDAVTSRAIWSDRSDGSMEDIFELQDRIAAGVLGSIEPRVRSIEAARIVDHPTESLDAYRCVLKATTQLYRFTEDGYQQAGELLERAIRLDPDYAQAYAYQAWWLNFRIGDGWSANPDADRAKALEVSSRAIELDREDPFALAVAAHARSFLGRRPEDAIGLFDTALSLDPNSAFAWGLSALTLAYLGRPDEAIERLQNVWRLNPFDPLNFYFWIVAGISEFVAGRYDQSIVWLRKGKRENPRFIANLRMLAASLALSGDEVAAREVGRELLVIEPFFRISTLVSWYPLRRPEDLARLATGLRVAGMPE